MINTQRISTYHQAVTLLGLGYTLEDSLGRKFKLRVSDTDTGTIVDYTFDSDIELIKLPAKAIDAGVTALEVRPAHVVQGADIDVVIQDDCPDTIPKLRDDLVVYGTETGRINLLDTFTSNAFLEHKTQRRVSEPNQDQEELQKSYLGEKVDFTILEKRIAAFMTDMFMRDSDVHSEFDAVTHKEEVTEFRKPYIPVGRYALRIFGEGDKKLMEISSPFERTATIALSQYLVPDTKVNEDELMAVLRNARPDHQRPNYGGDGITFAQNIFDELAGERITSVKVFLVVYDTKLNPWYPK